MHKLPVLMLCLLAALACMTVFICLSDAFPTGDTEYGSATALFSLLAQ